MTRVLEDIITCEKHLRALTFLQPLYGIDRLTVDAQLEIEARRPGRRQAYRADRLTALEARAFYDADLQQIAVKAEALRPVLDDDEMPESGKRARERDDAVVDGVDISALLGGDFNAGRRRASAEPASDGAADRPVEVAAKRAQ